MSGEEWEGAPGVLASAPGPDGGAVEVECGPAALVIRRAAASQRHTHEEVRRIKLRTKGERPVVVAELFSGAFVGAAVEDPLEAKRVLRAYAAAVNAAFEEFEDAPIDE